MSLKSIRLGASCAVLTSLMAAPAFAQDVEPTFSMSIDYVSEYVFRGTSFEAEAIQPGVELGLGNFAAGVWASTGLGSDSLADTDEIDFYVGYGFDLSDMVSASVGATWYHFPDGGDTYEGYIGLGFDAPLAPAITAYYDIELEALTLEGSVGHSIAMPDNDATTFDLGLVGGLVTADGGGDYEWVTASAAISHAVNDIGSFYIGLNYTLNSEDVLDFNDPTPDDNLLWAGVGIASSF
ncbi:MAG: TorF family putative porin [Pseudomonadota bacterium]